MLYFYQHLPEIFDPTAFAIGGFEIRWYSIMYLAAFFVFYLLSDWRIEKGEVGFLREKSKYLLFDFLVYSFAGLIVGARLGQVFFYDAGYFWQNPWAIVSPFDADGNFVGIFGMSYFGGLLGVIVSSIVFAKRKNVNFWQWLDFVVPAIPLGYFFGRLGNFLNGELYGKATNYFWGMYFGDGILRHPTQIYEAFFEGLVLFFLLWFFRNNSKFPGNLAVLYLAGYATVRFGAEFLREPEGVSVGIFTIGQILSLAMLLASLVIFLLKKNKIRYF